MDLPGTAEWNLQIDIPVIGNMTEGYTPVRQSGKERHDA
jgi:hypothetical protein